MLIKHEVKTGSHDFTPNSHPLLTWSTKCDWSFQMDPSMYYTREDEDYPYDNYNGWNKLGGGFTKFFSANNKNSVMLAWFPDETTINRWNIVGYTNDSKGGWKAELLANVGLEEYEGQTIWLYKEVVFKIRKKGDADYTFLNMPAYRGVSWWPRRGLGAYFGGQFVAFKNMLFYAVSKY